MVFTGQIHYEQTRRRNRLVLQRKWGYLAETVFIIGMLLSFLALLLYASRTMDNERPNERFLAYVLFPAVALVCALLIFKKLTERRLMVIPTGLDKATNRRVVQQAMKEWHWRVWTDNANYLQATTTDNPFWEAGHAVTLLLEDGAVRLNVLGETRGGRAPVLVTDYLFRYDFKRYFREYSERTGEGNRDRGSRENQSLV